MPRFEITGPNGERYEITAPEGATEQQALQHFQDQLAATPETQQDAGQGYQLTDADKKGVEFVRQYGIGPTNSIVQGATLGFADEIASGLLAPIDALVRGGSIGENYDRSMAIHEAILQNEQEDYPVGSMVSEIGGGALTGGAMAKGGLTLMNSAKGLLAKAGRGAVEGGIYGAISGAGHADEGNRIEGAAYGGGVGSLGGGAAPYVAAGLGKAVNPVVKKGQEIARRVMYENPAAKKAGLSPNIYRVLRETLQDDMRGGVNRIAGAADDAMLADAGPGSAGLLDAVGQVPGGRQIAQTNVGNRVTGASQRVTAALDEALGKPGESSSRALMVYGDKTNPLSLIYKRAYSKPIDYSSETGRYIEGLVKGRVPKDAIAAANRLMRVEGEESKQILAKVADDGSVIFETLPDVRQLDYITRGLNQVADSADGKGAFGGMTPVGRAYANLSREIRSSLKEAVPEYKSALNVAADMIRTGKARDVGKVVLSPRMTREELTETLSDMGGAELRKVSEGVRMHIDDTMANVKRAMTDTNMDAREAAKALGDLSGRANREKLTALLGSAKAQRLFGEIDQADKAFQLRAAMAQNSKTAPRQLFNDQNKAQAEEGIINQLRMGRPVASAQSLTQRLTGRTPADIDALASKNAVEIATALTGPRGAEMNKLAALLLKQEPRTIERVVNSMKLNPEVANSLMRGLAIKTGGEARDFLK